MFIFIFFNPKIAFKCLKKFQIIKEEINTDDKHIKICSFLFSRN